MTRRLAILAGLGLALAGCGAGDDGLDKAAAPTASSPEHQPAANDIKKTQVPPLAGPGATGAPKGGNW